MRQLVSRQAQSTASSASAAPDHANATMFGRGLAAVNDALRSPGRPLDGGTRGLMESRFGWDFGRVRIHNDARAAEATKSIEASAFTVGQNIVFGDGSFRPDTTHGRALIAHELAHTVQQGPAPAKLSEADVSQPGDSAELEAEAVATEAMKGARPKRLSPVPIRAARKAISRVPLKTNGGEFTVSNNSENDTDPGNDTVKQVGAKIDINFTSAESVTSDKIAFVQIGKTLKNGTPYLFANEKPRATEAKDGEAGWALDRVAGYKSPIYNQENDRSEGSNTHFGHRKSKTDFKDAWMHDGIALNRDKGMTVSTTFTAFVLDATHNKYLGALLWGSDTHTAGKTTKKTPTVHAAGDPTGVQKAALTKWNDQAKNPDVSKRNAPDQETVPVP